MKRLTIIIVFVLLALQFTCGNVSSKVALPIEKKALICQDFDFECKKAVTELNRANAQFWLHSYRIDSLIKNTGKSKMDRIILFTSSDPVHY